MAEKALSQAEIDALMKGIMEGDPDTSDIAKTQIEKSFYSAVNSAKRALDWARQNLSRDAQYVYEYNLHFAAHSLWCESKGITRRDYKEKMRQIIKREGLTYYPCNCPGWKLLYADGSPWTGRRRV
jgi:hypothetical protein